MRDVVSRVTDEGVEDNDVDELGEEIEVSHSNYIVWAYMTPDDFSTLPWEILFHPFHS